MSARGVERRRTPRVNLAGHRLLVTDAVRVRVVDISAGGALLQSAVPPPSRAALRVALGTGYLDAVVEKRSQSRAVGEDGREVFRAGTKFVRMSGVSRSALERFLGKATTHD